MHEIVPIMTIKLVMLPDSVYPLHIFEERYKRMISNCLLEKREFGIVAKIDSEQNDVGCLVGIDKINKRYRDGSMDILVKGSGRFIIHSIKMHEDGFEQAEIERFDDELPVKFEKELFEKAQDKLRQILKKTNLQLESSYWKNLKNAPIKSFKLAEKAGLSLSQRQSLLSVKDEEKRLKIIYKHLVKVNDFIDHDKFLKDLITGDGYLNE